MPITNAQLAQKISDLIDSQRARDLEYQVWLAGAADGGPYGDGRFPLTDYLGTTRYTYSPAALESSVGVSAGASSDSADEAAASVVAALAAQAAAETASGLSLTYRDASQAARDLSLLYRDEAASHTATALVYRNKARDWSSKAVDSVVESGLYSALHYATKASESYADMTADIDAAVDAAVADATASATASAAAALASETDAEAAQVAAEAAQAAAEGFADAADASAIDAAASALAAQTWNPANYVPKVGDTTITTNVMKLQASGTTAYLEFLNSAGTSLGYVGDGSAGSNDIFVYAASSALRLYGFGIEQINLSSDGRPIVKNPMIVETSGTSAPLRNTEFKTAGQSNVAFGGYAGAWRPSLTLQGDTNTQHMFMVGPASATAADAMIYSTRGLILAGSGDYLRTRSPNGIQVQNSVGTLRGYVFHDSTGFGLLGDLGGWSVRIPIGTNRVEIVTNDLTTDGFYNAARNGYIYANVSSYTYGGWYMQGSRNGYGGIVFNNTASVATFMANENATGLYWQSPSRWSWYSDAATALMRIYDNPIKNDLGAMTWYESASFRYGGITVSTSAASGTPAGNGALWIQYI